MNNDKKEKKENKESSAPRMLVQWGIFGVILFFAQIISDLFPKSFVVPAPLMGMIILYILLVTHIVKLPMVEKAGDAMLSILPFLFIPSGIQLIDHMDIIKKEGIKVFIIAIVSTIIILASIAYVGALVMNIHKKIKGKAENEKEGEK
ncbi:CidA/LrgA family protein [Lactobacillus rodentium]|uniref:Antiholin-like protein LrgA n=1 Tax=Lactobacillus rodentium TaxID=947835 RepID=A0A2Z6T6Z1_9LACO|nr:CidA/LrgA family protein [Lactobacillus rodentium]MCR1894679.1 CidA/LrgA family protein [Lactobacillus rodentium]GBG05074.1 antiholin-like protein LrgA [Lactobacillus rodentium]